MYLPEPNKNRCEISSEAMILALETSGRTGSVALGTTNRLLAEIQFSAQMRHSAELFPTIQTLLKNVNGTPADIKQVYVSIGPGSFTGLRIALAFAKTMSLAIGSKIVAVDTLDAIAAGGAEYIDSKDLQVNRIATILDAKRGQFFTAVYEHNDGWQKTLPDCLMTPDEFLQKFASQTPIHLLGEGLVYYKDKFKADTVSFLDESLWPPKASQIYQLGLKKAAAQQFSDPLTLQPLYLRLALET